MKKNKIIGIMFLIFAACIWGGMFVVVKSIVGEIPPIQLVWLRYLVGSVILLLMALYKRIKWYWDIHNIILIVLIGLIGDTISIIAQKTGTWLSSAQLGSIITTATPAFIVLFSWPLLNMKPKLSDWMSLIMATLGVVVIVGYQFTGHHLFLGAIYLLIAGLTWALMSVLVQLIDPKYDILQVTFMAAMVAIICLTPLVLKQYHVLYSINWYKPHVILSIFYLGAISTALAFFMWNQGLRLLHSPISGLFFLFQPITATLLGLFFLNEPITGVFFIGIGLILISVLISIRFNQ